MESVFGYFFFLDEAKLTYEHRDSVGVILDKVHWEILLISLLLEMELAEVVAVLVVDPRASCMHGKSCAAELQP